MVQKRKQADEIAAATGKDPVADMVIMEEVLGHRSGYRRGFGYGMPIDENRREYYELPRHEDFVHSEYDRTRQEEKIDRLQQQVEMLMNYVRPPPMSSSGQYPPYQSSAPHMGTAGTSSDPRQPGFTPFTPVASHPPPPPQGYYGMPSHASMYPYPPHDPSRETFPSSGQHRGQTPMGFTPWAGGPGFPSFPSQPPAYGSYPFPGATPSAPPSSSQQPPHTPTHHSTPDSTPSPTMSQRTSVRGSNRSRQRQHQGH